MRFSHSPRRFLGSASIKVTFPSKNNVCLSVFGRKGNGIGSLDGYALPGLVSIYCKFSFVSVSTLGIRQIRLAINNQVQVEMYIFRLQFICRLLSNVSVFAAHCFEGIYQGRACHNHGS